MELLPPKKKSECSNGQHCKFNEIPDPSIVKVDDVYLCKYCNFYKGKHLTKGKIAAVIRDYYREVKLKERSREAREHFKKVIESLSPEELLECRLNCPSRYGNY